MPRSGVRTRYVRLPGRVVGAGVQSGRARHLDPDLPGDVDARGVDVFIVGLQAGRSELRLGNSEERLQGGRTRGDHDDARGASECDERAVHGARVCVAWRAHFVDGNITWTCTLQTALVP